MSWLRRPGSRAPEPETPDDAPDPGPPPAPTGVAAPGVAAVLEGVTELAAGGEHAVLDLGPGMPSSLEVYGRFARVVRFADVSGFMRSGEGKGSPTGMLGAVPPDPARPYDLVFGWDVLDRLYPEYRAPLVERLAAVTAPGARLHVVVRASDTASPPLRFQLLATDRMHYEPTGPPEPARDALLPAEVNALLEPFRVVHGFTLKGGLREYVARLGTANRGA